MYFRILKKDLKRKKGVHLILLLFIIIATIFLASSVNNILVVLNATDYYFDKAKVADYNIIAIEGEDSQAIEKWAEEEARYIKEYEKDSYIVPTKENLAIISNGKKKTYELTGTLLMSVKPERYMKVYDEDGGTLNISSGEVAVPYRELKNNNLEIGDKIQIKLGEYERTLTIKAVPKDAVSGGDFVGMSRMILNKSDYDYLNQSTEITKFAGFSIESDNVDAVKKAFDKTAIPVLVTLTRELYKTSYLLNMIMAGILIVVGICLILIAFLVLRFTILFTLQEDYREIGIMKAVGLRSRGIKKIYLVKYFVIVVIGTAFGCFLSFPVSDIMIARVSTNMLMEESSGHWRYNVLCSVLIILVVLILCYLSTSRLDKVSAISAIRNGNSGERFGRRSMLKLGKHKKMPPAVFLALNDIMSRIRRYAVLLITFCIGTILIILPLNIINTMQSREMASQFNLSTDADFCMDSIEGREGVCNTHEDYSRIMNNMQKEFKESGHDVKIYGTAFYTFSYYMEDKEESVSIFTGQLVNCDESYQKVLEGKNPELDNEIAMSEKIMKEIGAKIGDSIHVTVGGETKKLLITGKYQDFMQLGRSARVEQTFDAGETPLASYWYAQGEIMDEKETGQTIDELQKKFPEYKFYSIQEAVNQQLGSNKALFDGVKNFMVLLVSLINVMITVLMVKIFMMGEKGEIAMMKSSGFRNSAIRLWISLRVTCVLALAVILGILLSGGLNNLVIRPVFGIMGASHIQIEVVPIEVYVIYPLILFAVITIATVISAGGIKKIDLREMNNLE